MFLPVDGLINIACSNISLSVIHVIQSLPALLGNKNTCAKERLSGKQLFFSVFLALGMVSKSKISCRPFL